MTQPLSTMQPSLLREGIRHHLDFPVVFDSMVDSWTCFHWSLEDWADFFGDKLLSLRIGKQDEDVSFLNSCYLFALQYLISSDHINFIACLKPAF